MSKAAPTPLVKIAAGLLAIVSLRAAGGAAVMISRFGALGDAAFFLGIAVCLFLVAVGVYRGRMNSLALGVVALLTVAARLMLDAVPILKYRLFEPVKWVPLGIAVAVGFTAILLLMVPSARRWFAEPKALTDR